MPTAALPGTTVLPACANAETAGSGAADPVEDVLAEQGPR